MSKWKPERPAREQAKVWREKTLLWESRHPRLAILISRTLAVVVFVGFLTALILTIVGWGFVVSAVIDAIEATTFRF